MNAPPHKEPGPLEKVVAGSILSTASWKITATLDTFSGWVLAGFGGGLTFLLGNYANIEKYLAISALHNATQIFVAAAIIGIIGRYFGAIIVAIAEAGAKGEELGEKHGANLNSEDLFTEIERIAPWYAKWWIKRSFDQVRRGDYSASGRFLMSLAMFHSALVFIGLCLALWALVVVSQGIAK